MIAGCFSVFFNADDNKRNEEIEIEKYSDEVIMLRDFLSTSMSMDIKKIMYNSSINSFIIGDILMSIEDARGRYNHSYSKVTTPV
ncbi:hypothetical protein EV144_105377 [Flavobacterium sp. 270]|nr:hypothetical protein EV144_105377 [Flavobacterium sp. 270]